MGPWSNGGRLRLGDRTALPLPACREGVYARLRRAMERSEFARFSRKFRVRGPLHESELPGKAPSPSTSPPLWRGPSPRPSPRKRGEGGRRPSKRGGNKNFAQQRNLRLARIGVEAAPTDDPQGFGVDGDGSATGSPAAMSKARRS